MKQTDTDHHYRQIKKLLSQPYLQTIKAPSSPPNRYHSKLPPVALSKRLEKELIHINKTQEMSSKSRPSKKKEHESPLKKVVNTRCQTDCVPKVIIATFDDSSPSEMHQQQHSSSFHLSHSHPGHKIAELMKTRKEQRIDMREKLMRKDSNSENSLIELLKRVESYRFNQSPKKIVVFNDSSPRTPKNIKRSPRSTQRMRTIQGETILNSERCLHLGLRTSPKDRSAVLASKKIDPSQLRMIKLTRGKQSIAPWEYQQTRYMNFPSIVRKSARR